MKFVIGLLDEAKIGEELDAYRFGGQAARIQRVKKAAKNGLMEFYAAESATKEALQNRFAEKPAPLPRSFAVGDTVMDVDGKIYMLDHIGWVNVTKQLKGLLPKAE